MTYSSYCESADFLRTRLNGFTPEALLILGSGLGFLGDAVEDPIFVDYGEIPHFRPSTAPGHKGRFVFGTLRGRRVAVMQGRMHCYEGYTMAEAAYAVRVVRLLGVLGHLGSNALTCRLDLVAQLVVVLGEGRLQVAGHLLHAGSGLTGHFLALGLHGGDDLLAADGSALIHLLGVHAGVGADVLRLTPGLVHLFGNHGAGFLARTGSAQQSRHGTNGSTCEKDTKFVAHHGLLNMRDDHLCCHYTSKPTRTCRLSNTCRKRLPTC